MSYTVTKRVGWRRRQFERRVKLQPARYSCPRHERDLTQEVADQVGQEPIFGSARRRRTKQPFLVIVSCPGLDTPHDLQFDGFYTEHDTRL